LGGGAALGGEMGVREEYTSLQMGKLGEMGVFSSAAKKESARLTDKN